MNKYLLEIRGLFIQLLIFFCVVFTAVFIISSRILFFILDFLHQFSSAKRVIYTELAEVFCVKIKTTVYCCFIIVLPFFVVQICRFVFPALYKKEKRSFFFLIVASILAFYGGILFSFKTVLPSAIRFFSKFQNIGQYSVDLIFLPKISEFIGIVCSTAIVMGLMFQLPVVVIALVLYGAINYSILLKLRRFFIVGVFALSAIVTPPDILSQLIVAIPGLFIYELIILFAKVSNNKKSFFVK